MRLDRRSLSGLLVLAALVIGSPAWAYTVLTSGGDTPGIQNWVAGIDDLGKGEAFVPIELGFGDPNNAYLNVAVDLNNDNVYSTYAGTGGPQDEWVIVNEPISIPSGPGHYYSGFFDLTDLIAKTGSHGVDIYVTSSPIGGVSPGGGTYTGILSMQTFNEEPFGPTSTQGPSGASSGGPTGAGRVRAGGSSLTPQSAIPTTIAAASAGRALPDRQQQVGNECFITSVAMSMKWLAATYPGMFPAALPAIADLITAMKQTDEWKNNNIIRWGQLFAWKGVIFKQYNAKVIIEQWNGTDDAYTWMKGQLDAGEDVEMSMGYKPVAGGHGHTVILTGWVEDGNKKYVTACDPLEPNKNGKQLDKKILITGTNVDYPSRNGTAIREIDAESPDKATPANPTTWGRVKGQYR